MSCHFSCNTCSSALFNECLTCPSNPFIILNNGACFCTVPWDSDCTNISIIRPISQILHTMFISIIPFIMLCYCLKVRLLISYRILVGFQSISMLLFTTQEYLNYESIFLLTTIYKSNGYSNFIFRNETDSLEYIKPACFLFISFLIVFLIFQKPRSVFVKNQEQYSSYLKDNAYQFFSYFYMFASRSMLYFIGFWLANLQLSISNIAFISIFGLIITVFIVKVVKDFHKNQMQDQIYQSELYIYNLLSPLSIIGLPLAKTFIPLLFIYISPIALLILIIIFNKNYVAFTKQKIIFYLCQVLIAGFAITLIMVDHTIKGIIVLVMIIIGILAIIIETSILYYGGLNLKGSKVYPQNQVSLNQTKKESIIVKNIFKNTKKLNSYY